MAILHMLTPTYMWYHIELKYYMALVTGQVQRLGELQDKILAHICRTKDADYKTLSKETDRDRITLKQSIDPLIKRRYITAEKVNPERYVLFNCLFRCHDG
jgi:hypothetical protein